MNRVSSVALRVAAAALILCFGVSRLAAQERTPATQPPATSPSATPPQATPPSATQPPAAPPSATPSPTTPSPADQASAKQAPAEEPAPEAQEEEKNPFAPEPAPVLPPGMMGSDASDPRAKLTPGLYDAGETSMGIKHLTLLKKADAFQLGTDDPDDPKVEKMIGQLGINNTAKIPKPTHLVIAQLAFANSDFAFQGNHLFQGNFYGVNIYDISEPANTKVLTTMVCPGGQGDVSVYKNLLFMS
ncbi:MAG TPA: hypothetical protein VKF79_02245, partial [Candidatus Acidoferrum sp.]|nr:hypothetical protein [Candidatus Acidoferrum sp.]